MPAFMAELEENIISLIVEEASELKGLINETALSQTWGATSRRVIDLVNSMEVPQLGDISAPKSTLPEYLKWAHKGVSRALDALGDIGKVRYYTH